MAIIRDKGEVVALTGIPISHMQAFQIVANATKCLIMSRAVGIACTGLIEEGYSSKGFHVKAKSCDWGPMAGFVLADPNLTKRVGESEKQKEDLVHAIQDWGATTTPLYISEARRCELLARGKIRRIGGADGAEVVSAQPGSKNSDGAGRSSVKFAYRLVRTPGNKLVNAPAPVMWAVHYLDPSQAVHVGGGGGDGSHVRAMVNPAGLGGRAPGVRGALTGDYDLFTVATHRDKYQPGGATDRGKDARMISVRGLEANIKGKAKDVGEDIHLGNISGRLRELRGSLNAAFLLAGYQGGNMVHHSDEAGRPFVNDVDLPVFGVVPGQAQPYGIAGLDDLREFLTEHCRYGPYVPMLNPGWMSWLIGGEKGKDVLGLIRKGVALKPVTAG